MSSSHRSHVRGGEYPSIAWASALASSHETLVPEVASLGEKGDAMYGIPQCGGAPIRSVVFDALEDGGEDGREGATSLASAFHGLYWGATAWVSSRHSMDAPHRPGRKVNGGKTRTRA